MEDTIFDARFFAGLNRLKLAMNVRLDRGMSGGRKSSEKGSSVEFSDFREYLPGDDIRRIDWNVYGRLDKLYIKQFMEEKEACYRIFLDNSASMNFGEKKKSVMARQIAAAFAWLICRNLDRVEIISLQEGMLAGTAKAHGRSSFQKLLDALDRMTPGGATGINKAVKRASFTGKGISILISDFLDPEGIEEAVKFLSYKKQEILLVQVLAREEIDFDAEGTISLKDMEDASEVQVTVTGQTLKNYQETLARFRQDIEKTARRYGCRYLCVVSDESLEKVVFETMKEKGLFGA